MNPRKHVLDGECTLAQPGDYDWTDRVRRQWGLFVKVLWPVVIVNIITTSNKSNKQRTESADTRGLRETDTLKSVYTIQPVWQPVGCLFTQCSRLSNRLYNWTAGCQTRLTPVECLYTRYNLLSNQLSSRFDNRFDNRLYCVYKHSSCKTGLTTGCIV